MTDEEKKADPDFYVRGGYLKTFTWEEAWANYWRDSDEKEKQRQIGELEKRLNHLKGKEG